MTQLRRNLVILIKCFLTLFSRNSRSLASLYRLILMLSKLLKLLKKESKEWEHLSKKLLKTLVAFLVESVHSSSGPKKNKETPPISTSVMMNKRAPMINTKKNLISLKQLSLLKLKLRRPNSSKRHRCRHRSPRGNTVSTKMPISLRKRKTLVVDRTNSHNIKLHQARHLLLNKMICLAAWVIPDKRKDLHKIHSTFSMRAHKRVTSAITRRTLQLA